MTSATGANAARTTGAGATDAADIARDTQPLALALHARGELVSRASVFRHFCHLSCFAVRDCHSPLSEVSHFLLMPVWLKANQSVCTSCAL